MTLEDKQELIRAITIIESFAPEDQKLVAFLDKDNAVVITPKKEKVGEHGIESSSTNTGGL